MKAQVSLATGVLAAALGIGLLSDTVRSQARASTAADFFAAKKIYTFHLTIDSAEWTRMSDSIASVMGPGGPGGPGGFGRGGPPLPGGPPDGFGPPRGRGPMARVEPAPGIATLDVDGQPWGRLHARFKGNSSLNFAIRSIKKSFKLDFDDLDKDARFFGLAKLNLNNNAMDSSGLRESLAYDVFREDGTVAPRTAYARLYLTVPGTYDRAYAGLYTVVEQVDQTFARDRFGAKLPMLLKPERQGGQPYRGDVWAAYRTPYGDKSDTSPADGQPLMALTKLLSHGSGRRFCPTGR